MEENTQIRNITEDHNLSLVPKLHISVTDSDQHTLLHCVISQALLTLASDENIMYLLILPYWFKTPTLREYCCDSSTRYQLTHRPIRQKPWQQKTKTLIMISLGVQNFELYTRRTLMHSSLTLTSAHLTWWVMSIHITSICILSVTMNSLQHCCSKFLGDKSIVNHETSVAYGQILVK